MALGCNVLARVPQGTPGDVVIATRAGLLRAPFTVGWAMCLAINVIPGLGNGAFLHTKCPQVDVKITPFLTKHVAGVVAGWWARGLNGHTCATHRATAGVQAPGTELHSIVAFGVILSLAAILIIVRLTCCVNGNTSTS